MRHPSELEAALRAVGRSIGVCSLLEVRAHSAGERARARGRRAHLESVAAGLRQQILRIEAPDAVDERWDLRRLTPPGQG